MKFVAEYIWLGGNNELRAKSRTVNLKVTQEELKTRDIMKELLSPDMYEDWTYDGSSTYQASGDDSEVILKPVAVFTDPFRKAPNVLVLCETYKPNGEPMPNNHRHKANELFDEHLDLKPWYGMEQEFYLMENCTEHPSKNPAHC